MKRANFRRWEVAGSSHVDFHTVQELAPVQARDLPTVPPPVCGKPRFSRIPMYFVLNAAIDHLTDWVKHGIEPPTAPEIEVSSVGPPAAVVRDDFGNVLGGIRLAQHAVPTATNTGVNTPASSLECRTSGSYEPFDEATLALLYPDHKSYIEKVIAVTIENLKQGFIVGHDAAATIREAARSDIGRQ